MPTTNPPTIAPLVPGAHRLAVPEAADRLISIRDAAVLLGVCPRSVYNLIDAGTLPRVKLGGFIARVRLRDVEALMVPEATEKRAVM